MTWYDLGVQWPAINAQNFKDNRTTKGKKSKDALKDAISFFGLETQLPRNWGHDQTFAGKPKVWTQRSGAPKFGWGHDQLPGNGAEKLSKFGSPFLRDKSKCSSDLNEKKGTANPLGHQEIPQNKENKNTRVFFPRAFSTPFVGCRWQQS